MYDPLHVVVYLRPEDEVLRLRAEIAQLREALTESEKRRRITEDRYADAVRELLQFRDANRVKKFKTKSP